MRRKIERTIRIGKIGINKHNNYAPNANVPIKTCSKCGRVNHLYSNCKTVQIRSFSMPMPLFPVSSMQMPGMDMMSGLIPQNPYSHVRMPFLFNPCFNAFNMSQLHYEIVGMNNMYAPQMQNLAHTQKHVEKNDAQKSPHKTRFDSNLFKGKAENEEKVAKHNKQGT